jgi:hypothetical protein
VAVPFQPFAGHTGLVGEGTHDALHRAGQGRAGIGHAVAHGVAQADLDRHAALLAQLHELLGKGQTEAVDVGAGHVLEVAARDDAPFQGLPGQVKIHVHGLLAGLPQLEIDTLVSMPVSSNSMSRASLRSSLLARIQEVTRGKR